MVESIKFDGTASAPATPASGAEMYVDTADSNKVKLITPSTTYDLTASAGAIGGSTGSTDNAIIRANGTGGATIQSSGITITDNDVLTLPDSATYAVANITERSSAPSTPASGDFYHDDGSNFESGHNGLMRYNGSAWEGVGLSGWIPIEPYTELTGTSASISFSSIPATYSRIKIVASLRTTHNANADIVNLRINGDTTAANYYGGWELEYASGAANAVYQNLGATAYMQLAYHPDSTSPSNQFSSIEAVFENYASANVKKNIHMMGQAIYLNATGSIVWLQAHGTWQSTSAITSLVLTPNLGANFAIGCSYALYGML